MSSDRTPLVALPEAERIARLTANGLGADLVPLAATPEERQAAQDPGLPPKEHAMPDPAPAVSPSTGFASSEGKLTAVAMVIGFLLESVAVPLLDRLAAAKPDAAWVPVVLVIVGGLIQVAALFGYQRSRTALKVAALPPTAP